ncbi:hypothetical protein K435DRAFT_909017 [Dendrothele bispora CBS 962.96]|uniref:Uncharacterized protein n=1 Tax=Dendrothele bispora (strain CBS 962.96) TaxID=1314807 RepID=A0A4S8LPS8_DENBC|nr:hypothetical protein K435DRAFT_909017 [Dendrothele bispora CBS 962.96]
MNVDQNAEIPNSTYSTTWLSSIRAQTVTLVNTILILILLYFEMDESVVLIGILQVFYWVYVRWRRGAQLQTAIWTISLRGIRGNVFSPLFQLKQGNNTFERFPDQNPARTFEDEPNTGSEQPSSLATLSDPLRMPNIIPIIDILLDLDMFTYPGLASERENVLCELGDRPGITKRRGNSILNTYSWSPGAVLYVTSNGSVATALAGVFKLIRGNGRRRKIVANRGEKALFSRLDVNEPIYIAQSTNTVLRTTGYLRGVKFVQLHT